MNKRPLKTKISITIDSDLKEQLDELSEYINIVLREHVDKKTKEK
mgnify:CR=1 FL=1